MQHSVDWLEDAENAAPEEQATVGDLRLFLAGQNVTMHMLDGEVSDKVTVALYGLAEGVVHDWWSILGARDREFSFRNYRTGYLIPDLRVSFDGAAFEFRAEQSVYTNPDLRFWSGGHEVVTRDEGDTWLRSFVGDVLDRLEARSVSDTSLALRWRRIRSSEFHNEQAFCEAAGALGLDPYEISDVDADFVERAEEIFSGESLTEFASGSENVDRSRLMAWVERMARSKSLKYRLADLRSLVDAIARDVPQSADEPAWSAGYRRARDMRRKLDLSSGDRIRSFREFANKLGAGQQYNVAPAVDGISALRREDHGHVHIHLRNAGNLRHHAAQHNFAFARAVGDAACFPPPEIAPVNNVHNAYRQAAGRAFAAEFLAPIDEIRSMMADGKDDISIAGEFGVSPMVIEHQRENRDRIERACT